MALTKKKKLLIGSGVVVVLAAIVTASVLTRRTDAREVQTARVQRRALLESKVTASGEVRPVKFFNLTAEVSGRVTNIYVKEGDVVKSGQPLVSVDPTQIASETSAREAALRGSEADLGNFRIAVSQAENAVSQAKASLASAEYDFERAKADLFLAEADFKRKTDLVEVGVASKADFDAAKSRYDASKASYNSAQSRVQLLRSQLLDAESGVQRSRESLKNAQARVDQSAASLRSQKDLLNKTVKYAPIDGVVSSLTVREGEFALANFSSTPLMIIADMSQINVEVKVDESDIANVRAGQPVKVKIDAFGDREFDGQVTEVAASAITRSGQTIAQTTGSQEAKDFKVVVKLNVDKATSDKLRPGMSATAVITTDKRENVLAVPLGALVVRDESELQLAKGTPSSATSTASADSSKTTSRSPDSVDKKKKELQGIIIVEKDKVVFRPVQTGIVGETDIEITSGLKEGEEIVIGPFKQLRELKTGMLIKREAAPPAGNTSKTA